jgi:polysaccharide biosynthesis protein PslF
MPAIASPSSSQPTARRSAPRRPLTMLQPGARPVAIGMLGTYPPTQCGLATFGAALTGALGEVGIVRVVDRAESHPDPDVVAHLVNGSAAGAARAVRHLNGFDVVVVQHEYGIYGGPDGRDVLDVLDALTVPAIVVLHTVLQNPTPRQHHILTRILARAEMVVTMTETARRRLLESYAADADRVTVIPHGAADHGFAAGSAVPGRRPLVLTWGLIGPGKGIEWAIDAMPSLRDLNPRYLVMGRTHPKVLERDGEDYRDGLLARIEARQAGGLVQLDDRYLGGADLAAVVRQADVVLLPYDSREQVTSGVLIEAVAAGRPVVSTAFPHAVELLGDGTGLVVPQRDPAALASALRRVLGDPGLAADMAERASRKAPDLLWGAVAGRYRQLASDLAAVSRAHVSAAVS